MMLTRNLEAAGRSSRLLKMPDGARLLVLPYGARILGLYSAQLERNFLWTNPLLDQQLTAPEAFPAEGWHNTGGDRMWLAPELDIFFPDYPDTSWHWEPPPLDAAEYDVDGWEDGVVLSRQMTLHFARVGHDVRISLRKRVSFAPNPLRWDPQAAELMNALEYAGYTQTTTLQLVGESAEKPVPVAIRNLIQLPHGGQVFLPTYALTEPRTLFGEIPSQCLQPTDTCVRFSASFPGEHKFAVRAAAVTGRIGYVWQEGREWALLVRNFAVDPSGEYVDVPRDDPEDFGYAVHVASIDSPLGKFCELGYHAPAIGFSTNQVRGEDVSQVWAFRGEEQKVRELARRLLGAS